MRIARRQAGRLQMAGAAVLPVSVGAALVGYVLASWMSRHELVTGDPAVLAVLLGLVVVAGTRAFQLLIGRGRVDSVPVARLVLAFALFASLTWTAGWSFVLPAAAILVGIVHIQRSGAGVWLPALLVVSGFTVLGQIGVALGWVSSVADPVVSHVAAGTILTLTASGLVIAGSTVAERDGVQSALTRTEARLRVLMESSEDVLTVSDADGVLTYVSPAASRGLGRAPDALLGTRLLGLVDVEHRTRVTEALGAVVGAGDGARTSIDVLVELASHERRWFEWAVHNLLGDPLVTGLVIVHSDITDRLQHQAALAHAALHDDLTGLPNRSDLLTRITAAAAQAAPGAGMAVLFLDLDRFKEVNDAHGHGAGDQLLQAIARRLRGALRPHDHLARVSGDEFCAVLTEVRDKAEAGAVVDRLHTVVSRPVALAEGALVSVGVSIGVALTFGPRSAEELFTAADTAMYRDKGARRRTLVVTSAPAERNAPAPATVDGASTVTAGTGTAPA